MRDLWFALRRLRSAPAFTIFSITSLAIGIGAATAVYAVVEAIMLRPPNIRNIEEVVNVYHADPRRYSAGLSSFAFSMPDLRDFQEGQTSFSRVSAWTRFRHALVADGSSEVILGEMVDGDYFPLVGAEPLLGRVLQRADNSASAPPVIVLSEDLWRRRFNADPSAIGHPVLLHGTPFVIVGIAPATFRGVDMPNLLPTAAWVPFSVSPLLSRQTDFEDREDRWLLVKARLRPGVTVTQAAAEVAAIGSRLDVAHPIGDQVDRAGGYSPLFSRHWHVMPASGLYVHETVHRLAQPLTVTVLVIVGLVLLVACTNLANLLLARGAARRNELAVRFAMGGSRWRLVREQLAECALVIAPSGLLALGFTQVAVVALSNSTMRIVPGLALQASPSNGPSVLAAAAVATLVAYVVFGVLPALVLTRHDLRQLMASDDAGSAPRWRARRYLIASQVAVSVTLTAAAALSIQQVYRLANHDAGMDIDRIAAATVDFGLQRYDEARARRIVREAVDSTGRQGGIEAAAFASGLPVGPYAPTAGIALPGAAETPTARFRNAAKLIAATPGLLTVLGVELKHGRAISDEDTERTLPVGVVSENVARTLFGTTNVVGQDFVATPQGSVEDRNPAALQITIVGVSADTDVGSIGQRRSGTVYVPYAQHYQSRMTLVARSRDPQALAQSLPILLQRVDRAIAVTDWGTGTALTGAEGLPLRIAARLTGTLGAIALALAMTGLYGVLSCLVLGRRREIGVRMAVGASAARILRLIIFDGLRPVVVGLVVGLTAAGATGVLFNRMFRSVLVVDPVLLITVSLLFIVAGLVACYVPARRASAVDPCTVLRAL